MIATLHGKVIAKTATSLTIDCAGIGFSVNVPLSLSQSVAINSITLIHIQTIFTRNGIEFYGFKSEHEKEIFNVLTSVPGVGGRAAINILSRLSTEEITNAINQNRTEIFKTIPGIGKKKAEMIVFHLRKSVEEKATIPDSHKELIQALRNLGFSNKEAVEKLSKIPDLNKKSLSEAIELILKTKK